MLLLIVHHLVVDGMSWRVLLEDLESALAAALRGDVAGLPAKTSSYQDWALALTDYAQSTQAGSEAVFWSRMTKPVTPLPLNAGADGGSVPRIEIHPVRLDTAQTVKVIHSIPRALGLGAADLLLTAYLHAVAEWIGDTEVLVNLSGHGRAELNADLDLSRTVGWFTAVYPVRFELGSGVGLAERAHAVRRRLAEVPNLGAGYGVLRYLRKGQVARNLRSTRPAQLSFVYLGEFRSAAAQGPHSGALSRLMPLEAQRGRIVDAHYEYPLSLSISVTDGELTASWIYRADLIAAETVHSLAASWADAMLQAAEEGTAVPVAVAAPAKLAAAHSSGAPAAISVPAAASPGLVTSAQDTLVMLAPGDPDRPGLILVHPVEGHLRGYRNLVRHLSAAAVGPVYGLHAPGLGLGEEPCTSVPVLAERYLAALAEARVSGPYRLAGWSFGGLVAFEMASRLHRAGQKPELLAVIDSAVPESGAPDSEAARAAHFARGFGRGTSAGPLRLPADRLAGLTAEQVAPLVAESLAGRHGLSAPDLLPELARLYRVHRAHMLAAAAYRPAPYPGRMLVLAARSGKGEQDRTHGWERYAKGGADRVEVEGDHYTVVEEPAVARVAELLLEHAAVLRWA